MDALNKHFDESDKKWDKWIDSTKQMNNSYNKESVVVTENGNYDDGKLCDNENINKEATVNKVSENTAVVEENKKDVYKRQVLGCVIILSLPLLFMNMPLTIYPI